MSNVDILDREDLTELINIIINSYDIELSKTIAHSKHTEHVITAFHSFYYDKDLYSYFILGSLKNTVEHIFTNVIVRDFVLNLTDRVSFMISGFDIESIITTIVKAVTRNKQGDGDTTIMNKDLITELYISEEKLTSLLNDNFWLVVTYLLTMQYHETAIFKQTQSN